MDIQLGQMQQKEQLKTAEVQKQAREQFEESVRQYQPIMEAGAYRDMVQTQVQAAQNQWQEYLNTQVMDVEELKRSQVVRTVLPLHRADIMNEAAPESSLSEKKQEKRLKRMREQHRFATKSSVRMQEAAQQAQERIRQEQQAGADFAQRVAAKPVEQRNRILDDRFEQMFHIEIPIEVLAGDGLEQRYGQLQVLDKQLAGFAALLQQNPDYLQAKSPAEQERIRHYIDMAGAYHQVLIALSQLKGLGYDEGGIPESEAAYQQAQMDYATSLKTLMAGSRADVIQQYDTRYMEERIEQTYQKYEQGYEEGGKQEPGYRKMREEIHGDYNWMNIEHVSDFYQVDGIMDIRSKVEKNPQAYMEHKEIVDTILQDMMQQAEALGLCASKAGIAGGLELEYANSRKRELAQIATDRVRYYEGNYRVMRERMNAMTEAAKIVMGLHEAKDAMALLYLQEKEYLMPEQEQLKETINLEAHYYADTMRDNKEAYTRIAKERGGLAATDDVLVGTNARKVVLIRSRRVNSDGSVTPEDTEWNQKVIRLAELTAIQSKKNAQSGARKEEDQALIDSYDPEEHYALAREIITPAIQGVLNFDLGRLYHATPEELLQMQTELQALNVPQMTSSDIGKLECPAAVTESYRQRLETTAIRLKETDAEIARLMEEIIQINKQNNALYQQLKELKTKKKEELSAEEWEAVEAKKQELQQKQAEISAKQREKNAQSGEAYDRRRSLNGQLEKGVIPETLKQEIMGNRQAEYAARALVIRRYADMARGYALQEAVKQGNATLDLLTEAEQQKLNLNATDGIDVIRDKIKEYATLELIGKSQRMLENAWEQIFDAKDAFRTVTDAIWEGTYLSEKSKRYNKRFLDNPNISGRDEKLAEWLSKTHYKMVGETEPMIGEAIFRSYSSMMNYQCMEEMSDEAVEQMLEQLAAGAFLTETATQEEIAAAREENMAGLRTYVGALKRQYKYLLKKYGLGLDQVDLKEIVLHYCEMERDVSNLQVDYGIVKNLPEGILDMENEEDVLFKHLITYYNTMGGLVNSIRAGVSAQLDDQGSVNELLSEFYSRIGEFTDTVESRNYIKSHTNAAPVVNWRQSYENAVD